MNHTIKDSEMERIAMSDIPSLESTISELDELAARLREIEARQMLSPMLILNEMNKFYILRKEEEDGTDR
jgi:hypothetical protein